METMLSSVIKTFSTTPFLFVGAGLTRRYYNLPDWEGLLKIFSSRVSSDPFAYQKYKLQAQSESDPSNLFPRIAAHIEKDFNDLWFSSPTIRTLDADYLSLVTLGTSPFKAEIAMYIRTHSNIDSQYKDEVKLLKELSQKNITGVITTNYDCFLENILSGYTTYIGQEELIFSAIQGIAEIYKIHGSIDKPDTIIINERDYCDFNQKASYLAAKLMTIFLEYPIVFIGYSLTDNNIQQILTSIVNCLSNENLKRLEKRFIFIDYEKGITGAEIIPYTFNINNKIIAMTKVKIDDFSIFYKALKEKQSTVPVKMLRMFKDEFYKYTITNKPTASLRVAEIDDKRVSDEDLVLAIGTPSKLGLHGLSGIEADDWYRDIILDDIGFSADDMLTISYPKIFKRVNKLPIFKYLSQAKKTYPDILEKSTIKCFDDLICNTYKKHRYRPGITTRTVNGITKQFEAKKAMELIAHLCYEEINLNELKDFLFGYLSANIDIFQNPDANLKSNLRRIIRIYDWMKFSPKINKKP